MINNKATKYQKYLTLTSVFLIITSTILIFTAVILMKFYHLDKIGFLSQYYEIVPYYMISLGVFTFLVSLFGFCTIGSEHRGLIVSLAILLAIAFLAQLGSIFTALEVRNEINKDDHDLNAVTDNQKWYGKNASVTANWDALQSSLSCCGGGGKNGYGLGTGFNEWKLILQDNSLPDSCCLQYEDGCGKGALESGKIDEIRDKVFVHGCLTLLFPKLINDVKPIMIVYAVVGIILAFLELIAVVLACAFVAQIRRRMLRQMHISKDVADAWRVGDAGQYPPADETDQLNSTNHDTAV